MTRTFSRLEGCSCGERVADGLPELPESVRPVGLDVEGDLETDPA